MPIENYGVLKGIVLDGKEERDYNKPHYQIHIQGEKDAYYRAAINVMSGPKHTGSKVLYYADEAFYSPVLKKLGSLKYGFTPINSKKKGLALDYIRGNIISNPAKMKPLPHDRAGKDNDLNDFLEKYVNMAIQEKEPSSTIYVFGSLFETRGESDEIFHFSPPVGIHNVHMNQGNDKKGPWVKDNGIWQDGGILVQMKYHWIGIFLAFQTQAWCTDDYGNPVYLV